MVSALFPALCLCAVATGCGKGNFGYIPPPTVTPYSGPTFGVRVLAGSTPVVGASVQFYAAGTTGNGSAPTTLLSASVKTDSSGNASIPANYTCPSTASPVYLEATGGIVGTSSTSNPNLKLLAAVGPCSQVSASTSIVLNEVTTVAGTYALLPFYANGQIGASATNQQGLTNAFLSAGDLANVASGSSAGTTLASNGTSPATRINSAANALNACLVNTAHCTALYAQAASGTPSSTLEAVADLARYPGKNPAAIFMEASLSDAFSPVLPSVPLDWTMFVTYTGGGLNTPGTIAVDATGSVWVSNYFYTASKFSTQGVPAFAGGVTGDGLNNSYGLAIDPSGNVWIPNEQPYNAAGGIGSVTELNSAGVALSGASGYIQGGFNYPISAAIDSNGTTWVVDYGNSHLTLLNSSGVPLSGASGYTTPLFVFPVFVAVDGNHFGWIANQSSDTVTHVAPDGSSFQNYSCCNGASGIAIDASNNVWVANYYGNNVSLLSSGGNVVSSGYTGGSQINHPQGIAVDGAGNIWVANYRAVYLTELAGASSASPGAALSPVTGLGGDASLLEAFSLALDASGNVWVANGGNNSITKFFGMAVPVKTPLSGVPKQP